VNALAGVRVTRADPSSLYSITIRSGDVPSHYVEAAQAKRAELIESLAEVDDEIAEAWLDEREIAPEELVVSQVFFPLYNE
jgi:translation elongation factor EF-G